MCTCLCKALLLLILSSLEWSDPPVIDLPVMSGGTEVLHAADTLNVEVVQIIV